MASRTRTVSETKISRKQGNVSEAENYLSSDSDSLSETGAETLYEPGLLLDSDSKHRFQDPDPIHQNSECTFWRPWNGSRRPFRCRACNTEKTFKRDPELRRHMRTTHMNQIERCTVCYQEFTRKDNLTRHMKSKHNAKVKPACKFCSKQLSRKDAVHRHEVSCRQNSHTTDMPNLILR